MSLKIEFSHPSGTKLELPSAQFLKEKLQEFNQTIARPDIGFFHLDEDRKYLNECLNVFQKFKDRTNFVHVGIGGSSLGPEMLIDGLYSSKKWAPQRNFHFINNVDPTILEKCLLDLDPKSALFFFVSKSGGTAETMAALAAITNWLLHKNISKDQLGNYFVFATDPQKGDLLKLGTELSISTLKIPSNVGGRFSVLSPVGLLPALFAGLPAENLLAGAASVKPLLLNPDVDQNPLLQTTAFLYSLAVDRQITQTVLMPYSSQLKNFSNWFVQLWAESLGKKKDLSGKVVHKGFTPIPALGATDQHSQLQLFMEGPKDKCVIFLEVAGFESDFPLKNDFQVPSLKKLAPFSMEQLLKAELEGTLAGLKEEGRPLIRIRIDGLNEKSLGSLILFFESLTVMMGHFLNIDPFDQPGVEASKIYAFKWLEQNARQGNRSTQD